MRTKVYSVIYPLIWIFMRLFHPWRAEGVDNIPEGQAVICGNHTTLGDPLYVVCAMGGRRQTHVMAKAEVMKWPVVGFLLKKAGIIGVNRGKSDMAAVKECLRVLRGGEKLLMFPEGPARPAPPPHVPLGDPGQGGRGVRGPDRRGHAGHPHGRSPGPRVHPAQKAAVP